MSNLPILYQNILFGLGSEADIAAKAFLWAADARDAPRLKYKAEGYAHEVKELVFALRPMLRAARRIHDTSEEVMSDLMRFILKRHGNHFWGGNVTMWWESSA